MNVLDIAGWLWPFSATRRRLAEAEKRWLLRLRMMHRLGALDEVQKSVGTLRDRERIPGSPSEEDQTWDEWRAEVVAEVMADALLSEAHGVVPTHGDRASYLALLYAPGRDMPWSRSAPPPWEDLEVGARVLLQQYRKSSYRAFLLDIACNRRRT